MLIYVFNNIKFLFTYTVIMRKTTDQQRIEIVQKYKDGFSSEILGKQYNISSAAIRGLLHRRNVQIRNRSEARRQYKINESFFDKIDTEHKAYFLGILFADGYNDTNRNAVNLSLKESDKEILIKLNSLLQPKKPLQYVEIKNKNHSNCFRLVIANKHISQQLKKLGCVIRKTYILQFPLWLQDNLLNHFIRGYFDGDGCLYISKTNSNVSFRIEGTICFCNTIKLKFKKQLNVNSSISQRHPKRNNGISTLNISGSLQVIKVMDWLYHDASIFMARKHNKFITRQLPQGQAL